MKKDTFPNRLALFLREQLPLFFFALCQLLLFLSVFLLYGLELEAWLYGEGLFLIGLAVYLIIRYVREQQDHRERLRILSAGDYSRLKPPSTPREGDLQAMVQALGQQCSDLSTRWRNEKQESLDYYTTWVHQIKTPISVMEMLLQAEDTPENRALATELFRIEQYVEMVLTYIRLESPDHDFVFQELDLDPLIRRAVRKYAPQFVQRRIRLVYEPVHISVLTDEKWLSFILEQLLSNAIKYTGQGTVTLTVTPDKRLTVTDTGMGIAPEDLPRIFEKGFTGYNGRADKKSTGLGLYLCKQTADRLGIGISAISTPGVGSSFTLSLDSKNLEVE